MNQNLLAIYYQNSHLFDDMETVDSYTSDEIYAAPEWQFSKDNLVNHILAEYGGLCSIIGDPDQLQDAIKIWSKTRAFEWTEIYKMLFIKYNPLKNISITETETNSRDIVTADTLTKTGTETTQADNSKTTTFNDTELETNNLSETISETIDQTEAKTTSETTSGSEVIDRTDDRDTSETTTSSETRSLTQVTDDDSTSLKQVTAYNNFALVDSEKITGTDDRTITDSGTIGLTKTVTGSDTLDTDSTTTKTGSVSGSESIDTDATNSKTGTKTGTVSNAHTGTNSDRDIISEAVTSSGSSTESGRKDDDYTGSKSRTGYITDSRLIDAIVTWREYKNVNLYDLIAREFKKEFLIQIW